MAKGKIRIGYAIMTKRGNLLHAGPRMWIYRTKRAATLAMQALRPATEGCEIVRVTIDADS